ncbi:MAG: enoyl-CoA hydratase-related protein [Rhodobacteraceae bacterium]|nr:enoyl-CoA hydratase-related protein [Paracoccaceae bacterium]
MAYENIIVEVTDHIGIIRLDRPNKLNALNESLRGEVVDALGRLDADDDVRCLVLTGSEKVFSAGADISEMHGRGFVEMFADDGFGRESRAFLELRKPIIAAVAGPAFGGGCELAMMCDMIVAADNAVFGQPEINIGVIAGLGGTQRLTRAVGKSKSMEMNLTGRRMEATEAEKSGLVSRVVPQNELMDSVLELAGRIAEQPPLAVMAVKEAVNRAEEMSLREGLLFERRLFHSLFATDDKDEGMGAFVDKRNPRFRGR